MRHNFGVFTVIYVDKNPWVLDVMICQHVWRIASCNKPLRVSMQVLCLNLR
jgi:hypothetical protein